MPVSPPWDKPNLCNMKSLAILAGAALMLPLIPQNAEAGRRDRVVVRHACPPAAVYRHHGRAYHYSRHYASPRYYSRPAVRGGVSISIGRPYYPSYYHSGYYPRYYRSGFHGPHLSVGFGRYGRW
jgi:hypothetical protein